MNRIKLSVVIPAYNEASNINDGVLDQVNDYLKKQSYAYEVLLVDDGSKDNTVEVLKKEIKNKPNFRLIENPHGGKAITVMTGMLKSTGEIAVFTDMDQATPISQIEKVLPKFEEGYDIVIGSRQGRKGAPLVRKVVALGFALIRRIIVGLPFSDTQCGFKAFNRQSIETVFPGLLREWKTKKEAGAAVNAGFDVEALFVAKKKGYKILEVPVQWHHVGTERVQLIKDSIEAVKDMLRIRLNDLRGNYSSNS